MKDCATAIALMNQEDILCMERDSTFRLPVNGQIVVLELEDVEILSEDIPGWQVASEGRLTVALDVTISEELRQEGIARELINRVQNLRKDRGFEVTDRIDLQILSHDALLESVLSNKEYICAEILAASLNLVEQLETNEAVDVEVDDSIKTRILITKHLSKGI
ncbi:MAG: DUF5915 domain-containing protein [Bacteroidota bacterium]